MSRTRLQFPLRTLAKTVRSTLMLSGLLLAFATKAQTFSITGGNASSCSGLIEDSGGPASPYSDNEDYTFTICPDIPGNVVYLTWFVFDLSTAGGNSADNLTIYDGDNTSATTLGTYRGTALQNLIVSGTVFNTSGCLTLVFHSNGSGTGNFSCGFQCTTPCEHPTAAAVMSEAVPALICQGETVQFDGSASYAASGFTIAQYLWDFHDGSVDSTSGPFVSHTFATPGEHMVQLLITDNNDCESLNLVDQQVLVSTTPSFASTTESTQSCNGAQVTLVGHVEPVTWTGIPDVTFGEGVYLPDDVGQPFTSELHFEQFDAGQTVTSLSDIQSICVDMEHSFMGDLVEQIICPNGQTVILHQQNGGGTYLGSPYDYDSDDDPQPGICWHYCWSPTATNGTWAQNATNGNTMPSGEDTNGQALIPGTYQSVQPFSNLIGCPLNGTWTYQSTDLWGADNGFICGWEINFNPSIIPNVTQFTPTIGEDADSTYWTGPNMDAISTNGDTTTITVSVPGVYQYQYHAIDNFGCHYDTTITITSMPPIQVNAGMDVTYCDTPVMLHASTPTPGAGYDWTPPAGLSNPHSPSPFAVVTQTTEYVVMAYPPGHPECGQTDTVMVYYAPSGDPGQDSAIVVCASAMPFDLMDMLGGTPELGGVWTEASGATRSNMFDPFLEPAGVYTYTQSTPLGCTRASDLTITILPLEDPSCCGTIDAGPDTLVCGLTTPLHATIHTPGLGFWTGAATVSIADPSSPQTTATAPISGTYRFYWNEPAGGHCNLLDSVDVILTEPVTITMTTTDAVCFTYCDGAAQAAVAGGNMGPGGPLYLWEGGIAATNEAMAVSLCAGSYKLRVEDVNTCFDTVTFAIGQPELLTIDSVSSRAATCYGFCDGEASIVDAAAVLYSFDGGATYGPDAMLPQACAHVYDVAIKNAEGCVGRGVLEVEQPPQVIADFTWTPVPPTVVQSLVSFHNISQNGQTYDWDFAALGASTELSPSFRFSDQVPGIYPVCLIAYDVNNCTDTVCHDVEVSDVLQAFVPNAFSPDGNSTNDEFGMTYNVPDMDFFHMQVYDRWGRVVFDSTDPTVRWDGTFKNGGGDVLPVGVYAYKLEYRTAIYKDRKEILGHVTLLK